MKKKKYYLVERNQRTDQCHIILVNNSWGSSLEEIDLFTTQYRNQEEFLGGVNDCFIVNRDDDGFHFQEALFQDSSEVIPLANASMMGTLKEERDMTHPLLNTFCRKMKEDQAFYDKVMYGETPLYSKFVNYFSNKRFQDTYSVKYMDGCWVQNSYPLLRNVVWSIHHAKGYYPQKEERLLCKNQLSMMVGDHYHPEQPALFNFLDDEAFSQLLEKKDTEVEHGYQKCKRNGRTK